MKTSLALISVIKHKCNFYSNSTVNLKDLLTALVLQFAYQEM